MKINYENNYNLHNCRTDGGGNAWVQRDGGGGRGIEVGVQPVQSNIAQQGTPRMVGTFLLSYDKPDNAADAVGNPVLMGESNSTKFGSKNI